VIRKLEERLIGEIANDGPMAFEKFVERALYDNAQGFYAVHGQAGGRRGDFVTSVEVGPLFAAVVADWLDSVWHDAGRPADFRVAEVGAGVGTMFRGINRATPACFDSLTYTLVERSASMRVGHQSLPTDSWVSAGELPDEHQHVILANELLDNLAFGIAERADDGWSPIRVAADGGALVLQTGSVDPSLDYLTPLAPNAPVGTRVPIATEAATWVEAARSHADRVLIFDYAATTSELVKRDHEGWLRTYSAHQRGSDPLMHVGRYDITHDVPIDQLSPADQQYLQADWLNLHSLPERVDAARRTWTERAHIGDLQAMAARSAIGEAEALTDPAGLGSFVVLEWRA
jgi:NADH dehydrogenase [ubiquinone] 1 alpha subcomplex assembly factor 7